MVNQQLVSYIQSNLNQKTSVKDIKQSLTKQGFEIDEINEAFFYLNKEEKRDQFLLSIATWEINFIVLTMAFLSFVLITLIDRLGFFTIILFSLLTGFIAYRKLSLVTYSNKIKAKICALSAALPSALIFVIFHVLQNLAHQARVIGAMSIQRASPSLFITLLGNVPNPIISSILFYLLFNSFVLYHIIQDKDLKALKPYIWGILVYLVCILIFNLLADMVMNPISAA